MPLPTPILRAVRHHDDIEEAEQVRRPPPHPARSKAARRSPRLAAQAHPWPLSLPPFSPSLRRPPRAAAAAFAAAAPPLVPADLAADLAAARAAAHAAAACSAAAVASALALASRLPACVCVCAPLCVLLSSAARACLCGMNVMKPPVSPL